MAKRCGPNHPCGGGMQKGLFNNFFGGGTTPFLPSAQSLAVFAKMTDDLTLAQKIAIDRFINKSVARGHYTNCMDLFVLCAGVGTANNAKKDWINTRNAVLGHDSSAVDPTWDNASGFTTNGNQTANLGNHIKSSFIPSTHFSNASDTDHLTFCYIKGKTTLLGSFGVIFGAVGSTSTRQSSISQDTAQILYKSGGSVTQTSTYWTELNTNSMHILTRAGTAVRYGYNGQRVSEVSVASGGATDRELTFGARNNNGTIDSEFGCDVLCYGVMKRSVVNNSAFFVDLETMLMELGVLTASATYGVPTGSSQSNDAIVSMMIGQSLEAGHNAIANALPDITGALDGRVGWNPSLTTLSLQQLQLGVNNNHENVNNYSIEGRLCKEFSTYHSGQRFTLSKYAIGGSFFINGSNSWNLSASPSHTTEAIANYFLPTLTLLAAEGKNIRIKLLDIYQGQSDADGDAGADPQWDVNATAIIKKIIDDINTAGYNTSGMHILIHRILNRYSPARPFAASVRADQDSMPTYFAAQNPSYPGVKYASISVSNSDDLINDTDALHDSVDACDVRGFRVARFLLSKM